MKDGNTTTQDGETTSANKRKDDQRDDPISDNTTPSSSSSTTTSSSSSSSSFTPTTTTTNLLDDREPKRQKGDDIDMEDGELNEIPGKQQPVAVAAATAVVIQQPNVIKEVELQSSSSSTSTSSSSSRRSDDREKNRDSRERSTRDRDRDRDRDHYSDSSSSSKHRDRDRDRDRSGREHERERDRDRDRHDRDRDRDRKEREYRDRDRDRNDRDRNDRDRHDRDRDRDRDRDSSRRDKSHRDSSSRGEKERTSSRTDGVENGHRSDGDAKILSSPLNSSEASLSSSTSSLSSSVVPSSSTTTSTTVTTSTTSTSSTTTTSTTAQPPAPATIFEEDRKEKEENLLEESRLRRQRIMDKYAYDQQPSSPAVATDVSPSSSNQLQQPMSPPQKLQQQQQRRSPNEQQNENEEEESFSLFKENATTAAAEESPQEDLSCSSEEDLKKRGVIDESDITKKTTTKVTTTTSSSTTTTTSTISTSTTAATNQQQQSKPKDFDMFSDSPVDEGEGQNITESSVSNNQINLIDNWDDTDGYYKVRSGEMMDKYQIISSIGSGVFSNVVSARDTATNEEVVIKIIRNRPSMHRSGIREIEILKKISLPANNNNNGQLKNHCVQYKHSFNYRNHLCIVFEALSMSLNQLIKQYGKNVGLSISAVRVYAKQMFLALRHIKNCKILHSDIKPDNIVVNQNKNIIKLCDFGSAGELHESEITPYLVSRFYRAPEIILGMKYDFAIDVWSVGCCLGELYTGKYLFPGKTNNDMIRLFLEYKGPFPKKMLTQRKAQFVSNHFNDNLIFMKEDKNIIDNKAMKTPYEIQKPVKDYLDYLAPSSRQNLPEAEMKKLLQLKDLLERCTVLDPEKRITPSEALNHPFICQN
ncbi:putative protein serine/threonine kinase [Cavenderia fasciculata]|uniref:non-specific serine/threonine protein kinase n=1 Tax=Cavenderia fasciculata TaxID=261658 RepID=F4PS87_CACFS|nr:putative protein serine/threonine kinase [Cavenderia fasciculata]EGG21470.1 putative protein serine/threonine kinase [Cavenderia fasciculata]|eukprot:XP_004359320.1 putative protein serine/threonine kinase [Cavenderia fasciculata]